MIVKQKRHVLMDRNRAMELWSQGKTDGEIAKGLDVTKTTVTLWRRKMGLPPNVAAPKVRHLSKLEIDAIAANALGMSYGQYIAAGRPRSV